MNDVEHRIGHGEISMIVTAQDIVIRILEFYTETHMAKVCSHA